MHDPRRDQRDRIPVLPACEHLRARTCVRVPLFVRERVRASVRAGAYVCMRACVCPCKCMRVCMRVRMRAYVRVRARVHLRLHVPQCARACSLRLCACSAVQCSACSAVRAVQCSACSAVRVRAVQCGCVSVCLFVRACASVRSGGQARRSSRILRTALHIRGTAGAPVGSDGMGGAAAAEWDGRGWGGAVRDEDRDIEEEPLEPVDGCGGRAQPAHVVVDIQAEDDTGAMSRERTPNRGQCVLPWLSRLRTATPTGNATGSPHRAHPPPPPPQFRTL